MTDHDQPLHDPTPDESPSSDPAPTEIAPAEGTPAPADDAPAEKADLTMEERVVEVIKTIFDPEIPVNIYELGLIYEVNWDPELKNVHVGMTLTSPSCPVAGTLPGEVEVKIKELDGIDDVFVELVWDPPWTMELLSEAAKLQMGLT